MKNKLESECYMTKHFDGMSSWRNSSTSLKTCSCYFSEGKNEIWKVKIREIEEEEKCYWAWWCNEENKFIYIYPKKSAVSICFPYSIEKYIENGKGLLKPVEIIPIKKIENVKNIF